MGFYSCKAINEVGTIDTLGKIEITSTQTNADKLPESLIQSQSVTSKSEECEMKKERKSIIIKSEVNKSEHIVSTKTIEISDMSLLLHEPDIIDILKSINSDDLGPGKETVQELAVIGYLMQRGSTIEHIKEMYNTNTFLALKRPESQFALVQLVEREGYGKLISEILIEEHVEDDALLASTVGFLAFLKMIQLNQITVETVLARLTCEDFMTQDWESADGKEVHI